MRLKTFTLVLVVSSLLFANACNEEEPVVLMPVTTGSDLALELYESGMVAFDQLKTKLGWNNLESAVREDPDFFMAYFWMYLMTSEGSKKVAEKALQASATLNDGEKQIKIAFKYLLDGQNEKVLEHLQMAVDLYPSDPYVHKILYTLQFHYMKDYEGAVKSISRAINEIPAYAWAYNLLGYAFMELEDYEKAEKALDQYIKYAPDQANPYDSKGDFYMNTKQYEKAYDCYMKAFEIDSSFMVSEKKAKKAKQLLSKMMQS
jgi:tetratricopeptide (TPR) repeat protein